jgi:hypothetical protein
MYTDCRPIALLNVPTGAQIAGAAVPKTRAKHGKVLCSSPNPGKYLNSRGICFQELNFSGESPGNVFDYQWSVVSGQWSVISG